MRTCNTRTDSEEKSDIQKKRNSSVADIQSTGQHKVTYECEPNFRVLSPTRRSTKALNAVNNKATSSPQSLVNNKKSSTSKTAVQQIIQNESNGGETFASAASTPLKTSQETTNPLKTDSILLEWINKMIDIESCSSHVSNQQSVQQLDSVNQAQNIQNSSNTK